MSSSSTDKYIGVDVGTGSARACIINARGEILASASKEIKRWEPKADHFNQSSENIWQSICYCTKQVLKDSGIAPAEIKGIGFDATCSLVAVSETSDLPVAVGPDFSNDNQNIILWMDHRAVSQTKNINSTNHNLLRYVGGGMSIEMEIPKALWLKENMPVERFRDCKFYDLADYLTHRATGSEARSFCSIVCKQGYVPVGIDGCLKGWSQEFLESIGLEELAEDNFRRIGGVLGENGQILSAGETVGTLNAQSAKDLGLTDQVAVGSGVIDAYAGWIGTVAAKTDTHSDSNDSSASVFSRLAAVAGTSTCHLVMSENPIFVPGVWGPYRDVLIPGKWLAEGGQSATGELLHHVLTTHPAYEELAQTAKDAKISEFEWLNNHLEALRQRDDAPTIPHLARHFFFYGDLHGNRSPIADASMRGSIIGQSMNVGIDDLAIEYLAAVEFIGQQTRHIVETLNKAGHNVKEIYLSGGQCRNNLLTKLMATATGLSVIIPKYIDAAVVLGSAMLGAKAASYGTRDLWDIMSDMSGIGRVINPDSTDSYDAKLLNAKYGIFLDMAETQQRYRDIVDKAIAK